MVFSGEDIMNVLVLYNEIRYVFFFLVFDFIIIFLILIIFRI